MVASERMKGNYALTAKKLILLAYLPADLSLFVVPTCSPPLALQHKIDESSSKFASTTEPELSAVI